MNLQWNLNAFIFLGVKFTVELRNMPDLNYPKKLEVIKRLINQWSKRILTPKGKITIVKSLLISKLIYLFMALPDPPDKFMSELKTLLFKFAWGNKPDRIARDTLCQPYVHGGLKMVEIFFVKALKINWICRIFNGESKWRSLLFSLHPHITRFIVMGNVYIEKMIYIDNPFWE